MRFEFHEIEVRRRTLAKILAVVFAFDVIATLRHRKAAAAVADESDQPIARRVLGDETYRPEDDD